MAVITRKLVLWFATYMVLSKSLPVTHGNHSGLLICASRSCIKVTSSKYEAGNNLMLNNLTYTIGIPTIKIGTLEYKVAAQTDQPSRSVIRVFTQVYDFTIC